MSALPGREAKADSVEFRTGQRVHSVGDCRRIGTVKYVGPVEGYSGNWVGVDWDNGDGKHDGSLNGIRYFQAISEKSASFVRPQNLSAGITFLQALEIRYKTTSTVEEEDEMYVLSANNRRISVQLLGKEKIQDKLSHFEELTGAALPYLGISSAGSPDQINATVPNMKELDLTENLLSEWKDIGAICEGLPNLVALNLSHNLMGHDTVGLPPVNNIRILVLTNTGISWNQVEILKSSLPAVEELHLMGNKLDAITPLSSNIVEGFNSLRLLNLEDNCISDWNEILKLSHLRRLEQLHLNRNSLSRIWYPDNSAAEELSGCELVENCKPFKNLRSLLLGRNYIDDPSSVDSLNQFPNLKDIRLSENPIADPGEGGMPRFVLIARLGKVEMLNGSEITPRERRDSEIRYIRLVMSKFHADQEEISRLHPRFLQLKDQYGIEDERPSSGGAGPQKMGAGFISLTLKCVGPSMGEKAPLTKKLPATINVGKLKSLCENFFKLKSVKPILFLQEEGSPLPTLLDDDMASLIDLGVGNDSVILVDEDSSR